MEIDRSQMMHVALLADLGGEAAIKKLSDAQRKAVLASLNALHKGDEGTSIKLNEKEFKTLQGTMYLNLGSVEKKRSNAIVRVCKGIANKLGRISSEKVKDALALHPPRANTTHKHNLGIIASTRKSIKDLCEETWNGLSNVEENTDEALAKFSTKTNELIESLVRELQDITEDPASVEKINTAIETMTQSLTSLHEETDQIKGSISQAITLEIGIERIFDTFCAEFANVANDFYGVTPFSHETHQVPTPTPAPTVLSTPTPVPAPAPAPAHVSAIEEVKPVVKKPEGPVLLAIINNSGYEINIGNVRFEYSERQNGRIVTIPNGGSDVTIQVKAGDTFNLRKENLRGAYQASDVAGIGTFYLLSGYADGKRFITELKSPSDAITLTRDNISFY